jgi:hypothetical protein
MSAKLVGLVEWFKEKLYFGVFIDEVGKKQLRSPEFGVFVPDGGVFRKVNTGVKIPRIVGIA